MQLSLKIQLKNLPNYPTSSTNFSMTPDENSYTKGPRFLIFLSGLTIVMIVSNTSLTGIFFTEPGKVSYLQRNITSLTNESDSEKMEQLPKEDFCKCRNLQSHAKEGKYNTSETENKCK